MADDVFVSSSGRDAADSIAALVDQLVPTPEDILKASEWLIDKRRRDTLSGIGVDGSGFASYSPNYQVRKKSAKVTLYSRNPGPHMLDELDGKVETASDGYSLMVGIFGNSDIATRARVTNEGATIRTVLDRGSSVKRGKKDANPTFQVPSRNWLGATDSDVEEMQSIIADSVRQRISQMQE